MNDDVQSEEVRHESLQVQCNWPGCYHVTAMTSMHCTCSESTASNLANTLHYIDMHECSLRSPSMFNILLVFSFLAIIICYFVLLFVFWGAPLKATHSLVGYHSSYLERIYRNYYNYNRVKNRFIRHMVLLNACSREQRLKAYRYRL